MNIIKVGEPKCVECDVTLHFDYDLSVDFGYGGLDTCVGGTCPKCQQGYTWWEHYSYAGYSQLKKKN